MTQGPPGAPDFGYLLGRYEAGNAGKILGLFHPFTLAIELSEHPGNIHSRVERATELEKEYGTRLKEALSRISPQTLEECSTSAVQFFSRSSLALAGSLASSLDDMEVVRAEMFALAEEFAGISRARCCEEDDPQLKSIRWHVLSEHLHAFTTVHELAHLQLSCASPIQSFCNAVQVAQLWCVQRFVALRRSRGIPFQAPFLSQVSAEHHAPDDPDYWMLAWANAEKAIDVLSGRIQTDAVSASVSMGTAESLVVSTLAPFSGIARREEWQIKVTLPDYACPTDPWGQPYGIDAIQEGYATVAADTRTAYTYFDLLRGIQNPVYHGEYFRLPYLAAQRLSISHPAPFKLTFLALCDLAMSSHIYPIFNSLSGEFSAHWHDLHPGWRFARALDFVARQGNLLVMDGARDFTRVVNSICEEFRWPSPTRLAPAWLHFNQMVPSTFPLSPAFQRENTLAELRLANPHIFCTMEGISAISATVTRVSDEGFLNEPSGELFRILRLWTAIDLSKQAVTARRYRSPPLPFKREDNIIRLLKEAEIVLGFSHTDIWPASGG